MSKNDDPLQKLPEKLSMLDDFGHRLKIIPAEVRGYFRKRRSLTQAFLILFFLILPWTKINGVQSLLLNLSQRKFAIFGIIFHAHDAPLIFFVLAILTLSLAFVTAVWGRVWCGWACPQTVFIDAIYRRIEFWVEGNYIQRRQLEKQEFNFNKILKLSIKWFLFFAVSSIIAHSFVAYFVGSDELIKMVQGNPEENWSYFLLISIMTGVLLFDFGWFREQFCIIMCPYGRFQSVLMDPKTVTVLYDSTRGEPRKGTDLNRQGDCVSCQRCAQVCPTGIDIRNGVQLECIACTACIDACDEIMQKVHKPKGLIRYASLNGQKAKILRPRTLVYFVLILLSAFVLLYNFVDRKPLMVTVLRAPDAPYSVIKSEGKADEVMNHFKVHIHNQTRSTNSYEVQLPPDLLDKGVRLATPMQDILIAADEEKILHFFFIFSPQILDQNGKLGSKINVIDTVTKTKVEKELILVGPNTH